MRAYWKIQECNLILGALGAYKLGSKDLFEKKSLLAVSRLKKNPKKLCFFNKKFKNAYNNKCSYF